jgi:hypothetical protein
VGVGVRSDIETPSVWVLRLCMGLWCVSVRVRRVMSWSLVSSVRYVYVIIDCVPCCCSLDCNLLMKLSASSSADCFEVNFAIVWTSGPLKCLTWYSGMIIMVLPLLYFVNGCDDAA